MKTNSLNQHRLTEKSASAAAVTRKMVRDRAVELAVGIGRSAHEVSKANWEQAKRELLGDQNLEQIESAPKSAAESEGWGPPVASTGHHVRVPSGDDEDAEGRSDPERLVERGVRDAGREQMRAAEQAAEEND